MAQGPTAKTEAALLQQFGLNCPERQPIVEAMQRLLGDPAALDRRSFDPGHFTASAFIVCPERCRLLLIYHAKLRRWLQPGGHLEAHDSSFRAAAEREGREETGVSASGLLVPGVFDVDIHDIPARGREAVHKHFDVRYAFVAQSDRLVASDEVHEARWVPFAEVGVLNDETSLSRPVGHLRRLCSGLNSG